MTSQSEGDVYDFWSLEGLYITVETVKSDNINRMITITDDFYSVTIYKWDFQNLITFNSDYVKRISLYRDSEWSHLDQLVLNNLSKWLH